MYLPRLADAELKWRPGFAGAVVVEGPRACGKTALARKVAGSEVLLDTDENARLVAAIEPGHVLGGAAPHLIDEWQVEPRIWNHVQRAIDDSRKPSRFILTGSAVPPDDITRHTGAGRMSRMRLGTMSLAETGVSSGAVPLAGMLQGEFQPKFTTGCGADVVPPPPGPADTRFARLWQGLSQPVVNLG